MKFLESYDCVSHFAPRTEYLLKHFAATTRWRRGCGHCQLSTPQGGVTGSSVFPTQKITGKTPYLAPRFSSRFCKAAPGVWPLIPLRWNEGLGGFFLTIMATARVAENPACPSQAQGRKPECGGPGSSGLGLGPSSGAVPSAFIFI